MDGQRMFELIEKLNFVRVSGTPGEEEAARILLQECEALGLDACIDPFPEQDGEIAETALEVTKPYRKVYEASALRRSMSALGEARVLYAEDALPANLVDAEGAILIINTAAGRKNYEALLKARPLCVLQGEGDALDDPNEMPLMGGMLRPTLTGKFDDQRLCVISLRKRDLLEMIVRGASEAKVKVVSKDVELTGRNVSAFIRGTQYPDEIIAFTAHMDSVPTSPGCYDNAAGSAVMLELARCFAAHPPKRSLRFIWTGGEEKGLLGSKHYVSAHADELEKVRLCVNLDLAGSPAGHEFAIVTGPEALTHHVDMLVKEEGYAVETRTDTYSSDCLPFALNGVPALSLGRFGAPGMSYIHCNRDKLAYVSAPALEKTGRIALLIVSRLANAVMLPFERKVSDEMRKKVEDYMDQRAI